MSYLLDTDTCIYWLKGSQPVSQRIQSIGVHQIAISAITAAELYFGAYNSIRVEPNLVRAETFMNQLAVLPLTRSTLKIFGQLKAELRKQGQPLADFDLLIASTALISKRTLVTNNLRHYTRIPDLKVENWIT